MIPLLKVTRVLAALAFSSTAIVIMLPGFVINTAVLVCVILFILLLVTKQLIINKTFAIVLILYLILSLIIAYLNDFSFKSIIVSYLALNLYAATLNSVFHLHKGKLDVLIDLYLNVAFVASLIGVFQEIAYLLNFSEGYNLNWLFNGYANLTYSGIFLKVPSIFTEPGYFAPFLVPAVYISLKSLTFGSTELNRFKAIIILLAMIFTFSLIGYFGLLISLFILFRKNLIVAVIASILFIAYGMLSVDSIKPRIAAFVNSFHSGVMIDYNFSSLVIILNYHITKEAVKQYPIFGSGIDSYEMMSDRIIKQGISESVVNKFAKTNDPDDLMIKDGGNLFFRFLVEFGLIGLILTAYVFWRKFSSINYERHIQFMCLIFLFTYAARTGQYLRFELWFFILLFFKVRQNAV